MKVMIFIQGCFYKKAINEISWFSILGGAELNGECLLKMEAVTQFRISPIRKAQSRFSLLFFIRYSFIFSLLSAFYAAFYG